MIYYISDLHFGHRNVIGMDHRPFASMAVFDNSTEQVRYLSFARYFPEG